MILREFVLPFTTGIAIFLFGMQVMRIGFENLFLNHIQKWLSRLTKNTWTGLLTGTITTAILQSSSAVTLLTIAFTNARLLTFKQGLGIVLGANIGTTLTTELLAFRLDKWSIYLFVAGVLLFLLPQAKLRSAGLAIGGFALLFIGMNTMQSITPLIKETGIIEALFSSNEQSLMMGISVGTIITALIQSSTATIAIAMNLINDQLITISIAIAIVLGSNIGTCGTALIGCIGANRASKQIALSHVLLNVGGVLLFYFFIPLLSSAVVWMTPVVTQQVAHAQTLFNVVCSLLILPFISHFEKLVLYLLPSSKKNKH
ncbi:Na/Pi cotransporter family protein [Bacillus horti]|uniref:Phosphate:Na+ symporter n=1 Tax=Caldalkalibacillus horti TaxID=77523 RepID=A0ABT9W471_9BACI|nr:Na/Pi symporter [Bacillus horti]MDQ0168039.1 phosphate:Na+ symporter [Bacillus horti]